MKVTSIQNIFLVALCASLTACGTSRKAIQKTDTPVVVVEDTINIPEPTEEEKIVSVSDLPPPKDEDPSREEITVDTVEKDESPVEAFNHTSWNDLLRENVTADGVVNYNGFKKNWASLRDYIAALGASLPEESWSKEDKLAYWMNAYNAMTVDLILRNYPLESIKDIKDPWHQRFWKLGSKWYNLDEIEHQILRKMDDPRIHFGINCASFSCPPLLNEAFTREDVDSQLEELAIAFINDPKRNTISENSVQLSKIFTWFAKDFKTEGSVIDYLNRYSEIKINPKARKSYKTYDWALNN